MRTVTQGMLGGLLLAIVATLVAKAQESRLDQMVEAAIHGPEVKKIKYVNHEFNVKKAKITDHVAGTTQIEGQISHYLAFRPDDQFYYLIEKRDGKIAKFEFTIDRGALAPHVGKLTKELPVVGLAQEEITAAILKLAQKIDGSWESEAELIAYAIALRVDPMSHHDLVTMFKQGKTVDFHGVAKTTAKVDDAPPLRL